MKKYELISFLMILTCISLIIAGASTSEIDQMTKSEITLDQFQSTTPIEINDDSQFSSNGFTGTGTVDDPYTLTGAQINGSDASNNYGIAIRDTRAHVIITGNYLVNGSAGISIRNATNFVIENNQIESGEYNGLYILRSAYFSVQDNQFLKNGYNAIEIERSNNGVILNNSILQTSTGSGAGYGIEVTYSSYHIDLVNNFITDSVEGGIQIRDSSYSNLISGNTINKTGDNFEGAIDTEFSAYNNTFEHNTIVNIQGNGVDLSGDGNNTFRYNTIMNTDEYALEVYSPGNQIVGNILDNNEEGIIIGDECNNVTGNYVTNTNSDGIYLNGGSNSTVMYNVVNGSTDYSIYLRYDTNNTYVAFNNVTNSGSYSLYVASSGQNEVTKNNFIDPSVSVQTYVDNLDNNITGNYYNDHTTPDENDDGFVDVKYTFDGSIYDDIPDYNDTKPLAEPVEMSYSLYIIDDTDGSEDDSNDDSDNEDPNDDSPDNDETESNTSTPGGTEDTTTDGVELLGTYIILSVFSVPIIYRRFR